MQGYLYIVGFVQDDDCAFKINAKPLADDRIKQVVVGAENNVSGGEEVAAGVVGTKFLFFASFNNIFNVPARGSIDSALPDVLLLLFGARVEGAHVFVQKIVARVLVRLVGYGHV